jgi:hypothetical protein
MSKYFDILVIIVVVLLALSSCQNSPDPPPVSSTTSTTTTATTSSIITTTPDTSQPVPTQTEKGVSFINEYAYQDNTGHLHVIGELKNETLGNVKQIVINVSLIDTQGSIITTKSNFACLSLLEPQQISPFEVIFQEILDEIPNYQMELSWQVTNDLPKAKMHIRQISSQLDEDGYYWATGEIQNDSSQNLDLITIFGSFYDSTGMIVAVASTFPDILPLPSKAVASFTIVFEALKDTTIQECSIQAEAY